MIIKHLSNGKYEESGSVRLEGDKVVFSDSTLRESFADIYWIDRSYTPDDGLAYLNAFVSKFKRSYGVMLCREKEDVWMK